MSKKSIKTTNGELVNLINGLFAVQDLKGVKFGLLVSKNVRILQTELKDLEEASKPTDDFVKLSQDINVLRDRKDEKAIDKLEKDNQELIKARKKQLDELDKLLLEEAELQLHPIPEDCLPADITGKQISNIDKLLG